MKSAAKASPALLNEKARLQIGRDQLRELPYKQFGTYEAAKKRPDPLDTLRDAEKHRLPELLPAKYGRMIPNAFTFYRGSVGIMANDLASQPQTQINVQLCGDAHLQNLGCFAAPDGRIVFDINDFDETAPGPWEWDAKRIATSIILAGQESKNDSAVCEKAAADFAKSYSRTIAELASQPTLDAARHIIDRPGQSAVISKAFQQAQRTKPGELLKKYAAKTSGHYKFKLTGSFSAISERDKEAVLNSLQSYRKTLAPERRHFFKFYQPVDVAFKIVGTGSVGLRNYIVLLEGGTPDDALFLQVKQEVASAYAPYLKLPAFDNQGERVVDGQRRIQPLSDLLLGWTSIGKYDFLVRQLNDHKGSLDMQNVTGEELSTLAEVAGELLARGHSRSGDVLAIQGYLADGEKLAKAVTTFAVSYAAQVKKDFTAFQEAVHSGAIKTVKSTE